MKEIAYPTWIDIDLEAIAHNTRVVREKTGAPILAVVKNDAYGFGALECAKAVLKTGAEWLAIVRPFEVIELREAGIDADVFVFGGCLPSEIDLVLEYDLVLPAFDLDMARMLSERALAVGKQARVHLKVDTGMGRFGVFPDQALAFAKEVLALPGLKLEGVFSHFAVSDDPGHETTPLQISRFNKVVEDLHAAGIKPKWVHLASSAAIIHQPTAYFNMVRAGGALFCVGHVEENYDPEWGLKRAFTWKAGLISCKKFPAGWKIGYGQDYEASEGEIIGVVPVGHGDGYQRNPNNEVLIDGQKVPVVGQVCMDQLMIRLPKMYPIGTEVVLVGSQGEARITPEEIGKRWHTSATVGTEIKKRVKRYYLNGDKI